ncbi:class I SAM-dependent methyltransferase [Novispirillum sp. DQ9]|uniref:class I SAM-dependent methyltransferase n=1 Tax=Novispirillum sp. DQ9 TaxID=3398612 RepID=UPI003C797205
MSDGLPPLTQPWPLPLRRLLLEGRQALRQGQGDLACRRFEEALRIEPNIPEAHVGLALARRPGPDYRTWLKRLHEALKPGLYLEIGVETGRTLRLAGPGTTVLGIDPAPRLPADEPLPAGTRVVALTSQAFFADAQATASLPGAIDLAFIDGDHRFEAVLHDFIAVEAHMAPGGVIALHDTWPLNPGTATETRRTGFYTGDGWKLIPCLRAIRPDLRLLTVPAPPTGLTLVTALNPASTVLRDRVDSILATYAGLPYGPGSERLLALSGNDAAALDQVLAWRATATAK